MRVEVATKMVAAVAYSQWLILNRINRGLILAGKYFEELEVGAVFEHQPHRTITETDNLLFSTMTHNPQPLHIDAEFAKQSQYGQILVNSLFTLGLVIGLSVADTTMGTKIGRAHV